MNTLDIAISIGINPKRIAATNGGEYASPCPDCGGDDRFRVWPEQGSHGKWWCRGCDKGGDAIQMLRDFRKLNFKEACEQVGYAPPERSGEPGPKKKNFSPRETSSPAELWQRKARAFMEYCHKELFKNKDQLAWLAERGINIESIKRFRLGWNPEDLYRKKNIWGLDDNGKKLWLAQGLVIPCIKNGKVARLRIRTTKEALRYYVLPGSDMSAMLVAQTGGRLKAWVVTEAELDAILIAQEAGDLVGAVALGNSSSKPDVAAHKELSEAAHILNALDFDTAGAKAGRWWKKTYQNSERWMVPTEKDPGDYFKVGGDIRAWIIEGLPPGLRPLPKKEEPVADPAPAPIDDLTQDVNSSDDGLTPYIKYSAQCKTCGRSLEVYMREGRAPTKDLFSCIHKLSKEELKGLGIIDDKRFARKSA